MAAEVETFKKQEIKGKEKVSADKIVKYAIKGREEIKK